MINRKKKALFGAGADISGGAISPRYVNENRMDDIGGSNDHTNGHASDNSNDGSINNNISLGKREHEKKPLSWKSSTSLVFAIKMLALWSLVTVILKHPSFLSLSLNGNWTETKTVIPTEVGRSSSASLRSIPSPEHFSHLPPLPSAQNEDEIDAFTSASIKQAAGVLAKAATVDVVMRKERPVDRGSDADTKRRAIPPRIVTLQYDESVIAMAPGVSRLPTLREVNKSEFAMRNYTSKDLYGIPRYGWPYFEPDWYEPNGLQHLQPLPDDCVPMHEWQIGSYQNCNNFHEVEWTELYFVNSGGARMAFRFDQDLDGATSKYVYKTIKYTHSDFGRDLVEQQRKEAAVMERVSGSKFLPSIYGYCSLGVMMDFMPDGNMHDYIKGARLPEGKMFSIEDRLRVAIHMSGGVADLHEIDGSDVPSYIHNDICCHQFLFADGVFKLNDFNFAKPILAHNGTNEPCLRTSSDMYLWKNRPVEDWKVALHHPDAGGFLPDKIDVWMMGNMIYIILTNLWIFEKPEFLTGKDAGRRLLEGKRSIIPEHLAKSDDPAIVAMREALDMCWTHDWRERPKARVVYNHLMDSLKRITGEENPDVRVTLPERNPNQRRTESDYYSHNGPYQNI